MRRYLLVLVVLALAFALGSFFAVAQSPSAPTASPQAAYAQPQSSLSAIHSDKAVSIIANGISPRELAVDSAGHVYLTTAAAPNRIFTLTGLAGLDSADTPLKSAKLALLAGDGSAGSLGDGGSALSAQFDLNTNSLYRRSGLAVSADGTIFVADTLNSTIRRIAGSDSPEPGIVRSVAGRWAAPQTIKFAEPLGMAVDRSGNLYVADHSASAIDLLRDAAGSPPGAQPIEILANVVAPASLALTTDGLKLFAASPDTGAVFAVDTQTRQIQSVPGFPAHAADAQTASPSVCGVAQQSSGPASICPAGLALDGAGNLFVADANSGRILRIDARTSALTTAASGLRSPGAIAFDHTGNLFVAEQGANRIIKFTSMGATTTNLSITAPAALPAPPAPRVCPQTAPFNFCDQPTGGSTPTQAFTLTDNTSAAVSGLAFSFTGTNPSDFQAASNTCGTSLSAGASCVINVDFAPSATGARSASLTVTDSAGDSAGADVSGTGDDFQVKLNGSQEEQSVIQGGTITYNFNIVPDAVFGGDVTIACPSNLPSLTTCTPSANTVTVTPGTPASFSIKFATTYNGVTGGFPGNGSLPILTFPGGRTGPPWPMAPLGVSVLFVALAIFLLRRYRMNSAVKGRSAPRVVWGLSFLLVASALAFLGGCKHYSVPSNRNTPPGSTTMLIQGSAQNAGRGVTIILDVTGRG